MDFKEKKSKPSKTKRQADDKNVPEPEMLDPTVVDRSQISFYERSENEYMEREVLRNKLRKAGGLVPVESDFEKATKDIYAQLILLQGASSADRSAYLEIKNLERVFQTFSLFNIAAGLAELRVKEQAKSELKTLYSGENSLANKVIAKGATSRFKVPDSLATYAAGIKPSKPEAGQSLTPEQREAYALLARAGRLNT